MRLNKTGVSAIQRFFTVAMCSVLYACGGSGQDSGTVSSFDQVYTGVAIDGYLARATAFLDTNNNGALDPWEPKAFTDDQGYFSYNPLTDTNYCAADAAVGLDKYCLRASGFYENVVVRIDGGYDSSTGEPFLGQLSMRVDNQGEDDEPNAMITPITSLLTSTRNDSARAALLAAINLTEGDIGTDFLNTSGNGEIDAGVLNVAVKVHKIVTVLSDRLTDTYVDVGEEDGTPDDASSIIYGLLSEKILGSEVSLNETLQDTQVLLDVLEQAETRLREIYLEKELDLPTDLVEADFSRSLLVASSIVGVVDVLIQQGSVLDFAEMLGSVRALEGVVIKAVNDNSGSDQGVINALEFFSESENAELITALVTALSKNNSDFLKFVNSSFDGEGFQSADAILAGFAFADSVQTFSQIGGATLKVSDLDLGTAPDDLKDTEIEFYFLGDTNATKGDLIACFKFVDGANSDGDLGSGSIAGDLVTGTWSLWGASESRPESYRMLLTIDYLGNEKSAILKAASPQTIDEQEYFVVQADVEDKLRDMHSVAGFTFGDTLPETGLDCRERLPSRIGL